MSKIWLDQNYALYIDHDASPHGPHYKKYQFVHVPCDMVLMGWWSAIPTPKPLPSCAICRVRIDPKIVDKIKFITSS